MRDLNEEFSDYEERIAKRDKQINELESVVEKLRAENDVLAHDYKQCLEQYDQFLKKKLICQNCNFSFVSVNAVQVNGYVYCSEECATSYRH